MLPCTSVTYILAKEESDASLAPWIADLKLAWNDIKREGFEDSLDNIVERLDELADKDCCNW
ncbi:MAG: hypothetical protein R3E90_07085 [Marinicella sp.]|nr:hypothetical protein [Xanthomonadales bacterium]